MYEYGSNLVDEYHELKYYNVLVQDDDGKRCKFTATLRYDRLHFYFLGYAEDENGSLDVHEALLKGGEIKFVIEKEGSGTRYSFTIDNADFYNNAYRILTEGE